MPLSPTQKLKISTTLARYIRNMEDATDAQCLEITFCQAGAYVSAARDLDALPSEQISALLLLFEHLYQRGLVRVSAL